MKSIYLRDIPLPEAQARFQNALQAEGLWQVLGVEELALDEHLLGRVLAEPVWAKISSPHYHASAMDGFAVIAAETLAALPSSPVNLAVGATSVYVDTGDPIPSWANAVIPIEVVECLDKNGESTDRLSTAAYIRIRAGVTPWSHVRPMGEDIVATELVFPAGHILRPVDLGALAASGQVKVRVASQPRVAILPTGSELKPIGSPLIPGDIIEYNSIVLASQIKQWGGEPICYEIIQDDLQQICSKIKQVTQDSDLILINAGSSAGSEDFTSQAVEQLGELLVHGVAVRPGHPVILGMVNQVDDKGDITRRVPIIGVPGYPVSAVLTGEIFIEPILACWLGRNPIEPIIIEAVITRKVISPAGDDDYIRVVVGKIGERWVAAPLSRGAGVITSLVKADGITIVPRGSQGVEAGEKVSVRLYRAPSDLDRTILAIGSHDLTLDLLAQHLSRYQRRFVSANAGSLGGLIALRRMEAHLAGAHLLDPQTGEYNLSYIKQHLTGIPVVLMGWVTRLQGLIVLAGNPKSVHSLMDLARPAVTFINRQRGAGTRVLLDYQLKLIKLSPIDIKGYDQEEYTHLAVAAAVASGRADCGLGIAAAAQALALDFIPLYEERYDLVIPQRFFEDPLLAPLIDLAHDDRFRQAVTALRGYQADGMGKILAVIN